MWCFILSLFRPPAHEHLTQARCRKHARARPHHCVHDLTLHTPSGAHLRASHAHREHSTIALYPSPQLTTSTSTITTQPTTANTAPARPRSPHARA